MRTLATGSEILARLRSPDPRDQEAAMLAIGGLGRSEAGLRYGPLLVPFLESRDAALRRGAADALASIDFQESIPAIERMVDGEADAEARQFADRAIRLLKCLYSPPAASLL